MDPFSCIEDWNQHHIVVVYVIKASSKFPDLLKEKGWGEVIYVADPAVGNRTKHRESFRYWIGTKNVGTIAQKDYSERFKWLIVVRNSCI